MDRNTITGFLLIFAMVIVYQLYFVPAPEVLPEGQSQAVSTPETPSPVARFPESSLTGTVDSTYVSRTATLRSDVLEVVLTTDGGTPQRATLKDGYLDYWNQAPIQLWTEGGSDMNFIARGEGSFDQRFDVVSEEADKVVLANRGDGPLRTLTYIIDGYLLDVEAEFSDARGEMGFQWQADGAHNEKGIDVERQKAASTIESRAADGII